MSDYISRAAVREMLEKAQFVSDGEYSGYCTEDVNIDTIPAADVRPVGTCNTCIHAEPFERNCVLNGTAYMHCKQGRGSEVKNVWHKYKKYYKDYSVVDRDGYCDEWADMRPEGGQNHGR